jgi:hypothetical protein
VVVAQSAVAELIADIPLEEDDNVVAGIGDPARE